jgi:hypothetical protein
MEVVVAMLIVLPFVAGEGPAHPDKPGLSRVAADGDRVTNG